MKKAIVAFLAVAAFASPALAGHNPTPAEGFRNYGQCVSTLMREQNEVRKTPEAYTPEQANDINNASCKEQPNGTFRIVFG